MPETYFVFYPPKPFWAIDKPDLGCLPEDPDEFYALMAEEVFTHVSGDFILKVCRDSLFMVRIEFLENELQQLKLEQPSDDRLGRTVRIIGKYYSCFNALLLLLETMTRRYLNLDLGNTVLSTGDAFRITFEGDKPTGAGNLTSLESQNYLFRFLSTYRVDLPPSMDIRLARRWGPLPETVLNAIISDFDKVMGDPNNIKVLNQIMISLSHYQLLDFSAALVQAWFVIEYFLNIFWLDFLRDKGLGFDQNGNWLNREAIDFFTGTDFTASIMSRILRFSNCLEGSLFKKLNEVRQKRNTIVHSEAGVRQYVAQHRAIPPVSKAEDTEVTADDCTQAFDVIQAFVKRAYDIDLQIPRGVVYEI